MTTVSRGIRDGDHDRGPEQSRIRRASSATVVNVPPVIDGQCVRSGHANGDLELTLVGQVGDRSNRSILVDHECGAGKNRRSTARSLVGDDASVLDEFTSPDAPRLESFECAREAGST